MRVNTWRGLLTVNEGDTRSLRILPRGECAVLYIVVLGSSFSFGLYFAVYFAITAESNIGASMVGLLPKVLGRRLVKRLLFCEKLQSANKEEGLEDEVVAVLVEEVLHEVALAGEDRHRQDLGGVVVDLLLLLLLDMVPLANMVLQGKTYR